jgi:transposase
MGYPESEWERVMRVQEVMMRALSGEIHWFEAARILDVDVRTMRRWREQFEYRGCHALFDRRRQMPSPRRAPAAEVERVLRLYRERYRGFNVRHFYDMARREHQVQVSYSWVKDALQLAGLVPKHRARGRHRRRREPRACFGELLHLDGSPHAWFALAPDERPTLITAPDDATNRLLYAQFWEAETTVAIMTALGEVFTTQGLPLALYTDRAHWAFHTPKAKGPVDKRRLTQVGRALARLGVEHIPAYSPQARGRSERLNRTLQDRVVNKLRLAGISTIAAANAYLREVYLPHHNATFSHPPATPSRAVVPWATWTWIRSSAIKRPARSARTTPSRSTAWCCRSRSSQAVGRAPPLRWSSVAISMVATRSGGGPNGSASTMPRAGPWPLPRLGTVTGTDRAPAVWTGHRARGRPTAPTGVN